MARPMLLMRKSLLEELYIKYEQGVPVLKLIRQYNLDNRITAPTLTKLLSYMLAMKQANEENRFIVSEKINKSLFPEWLINCTTQDEITKVFSNPFTWYYTGKMPLGEWKERETNN